MEEQIMQLEKNMWEAALHRDADSFRKLVSSDAVMICGGYRCLGSEYADIIPEFYISGYSISGMEVIGSGSDKVILHYVLRVSVENSSARDLEGTFHVVSVWEKIGEAWKLIFNMDSRVAGQ